MGHRSVILMALISLLLVAMSLVPAAAPETEVEEIYSIKTEELPGGAVSPGGASSFRFEYEYYGERMLFWGWTGPNDLRVMDEDLATIKVLELPTDDFTVEGARWNIGMSIIVWGNDGTGPEDSVLVYQYPDLELDTSLVPRDVISLETIDAASLQAGDRIMVVAGRAENGTSQIIILETDTDVVHRVHTYHENLTVQSLDHVGFDLIALDVEGGATLFNTFGWTYERRIELIQGPFSWSLLRDTFPWTLGGENGRMLIRKDLVVNQTISFVVDPPPLQAACHFTNTLSENIAVASASAEGGSVIRVYSSYNGTYDLCNVIKTEGTITSIMANYSLADTFAVSFSDGLFKRYQVTENVTLLWEEPEKDPDDFGPHWENRIGIMIILVVAFLIVWRVRKGKPDEDG